MHTTNSLHDVIVVGARPAGAATAMLLAQSGVRVLVAERTAPGADTMSTHALLRGGVVQLARWGLLGEIVAAGTPEEVAATAGSHTGRFLAPLLAVQAPAAKRRKRA